MDPLHIMKTQCTVMTPFKSVKFLSKAFPHLVAHDLTCWMEINEDDSKSMKRLTNEVLD
jgi:hypothetical protein